MSRAQNTLINGRMMTCPRCENPHDVLQFKRLEVLEKYASETTPCYKCPSCKWIFAPADEMPHDIILRLESIIKNLTDKLAEAGRDASVHD